MTTQADHSRFLRRSLQLDGVASGLGGAVLLVAAQPLSTLFELSTSGVARIVGRTARWLRGGALVECAAFPREPGRGVALNAAWVLGSLVVVVDGPLTLIGNAAVVAVAAAVLGFSVLEVLGLRRLREAS